MPRTIQVFEYGCLKVDNDSFSEQHFESLIRYNEKHDHRFFEIGHRKIYFRNYVGVLQVADLTIEILPKADRGNAPDGDVLKWRNALLDILKVCKLIKINSSGDANLRIRKSSLIDLYFETFLVEARTLLREGLKKGYRGVEGNISKLKGRLDFNQHIKHNLIDRSRFYTRYTDYDRNGPMNQILKQCLEILAIEAREDLSSQAKAMLLDLEDIDDVRITDESHFERLKFGRSTERYRIAMALARLIILNFSGDLRSGRENVLAILFDMNFLFEEYILRMLKKAAIGNETVVVKGQVSQLFWKAQNMRKTLRPDILIESTQDDICERVIVDTKWKIPKDNRPNDNDLKQMYVYNLQFGSERSILLYPKVPTSHNVVGKYSPGIGPQNFGQMRFVNLFDDSGGLKMSMGEKLLEELIMG